VRGLPRSYMSTTLNHRERVVDFENAVCGRSADYDGLVDFSAGPRQPKGIGLRIGP